MTNCYMCSKPILDHSEGQLHKCLKFLSAQLNYDRKTHTKVLADTDQMEDVY